MDHSFNNIFSDYNFVLFGNHIWLHTINKLRWIPVFPKLGDHVLQVNPTCRELLLSFSNSYMYTCIRPVLEYWALFNSMIGSAV